ncbi:MAG: hypothetical protein IEMM0008_1013 [bacterium]|nr:MAG: hypothetical protein IEMM0008_1013 [bacterium]
MNATAYKKIRRPKKPKRIEEVLTHKEYERLNRALRRIFIDHYEEIIGSVCFSDDELERLEIVKARRIFETHYERFA